MNSPLLMPYTVVMVKPPVAKVTRFCLDESLGMQPGIAAFCEETRVFLLPSFRKVTSLSDPVVGFCRKNRGTLKLLPSPPVANRRTQGQKK